jgi:putative transposase
VWELAVENACDGQVTILSAYPNNGFGGGLAVMKTAMHKKSPEVKARSRSRAKRIESTGGRFTISDELWALLEPLLAPHPNTHRFGGGRPRVPDRVCADGIFFVLRTGCQWNALSATGICPSSTAHDRFQQWVEDGFFLRFWQAGLAEYDAFNGIDWSWLAMDGAMTKAPLAGEKNRSQPHGSGQGRYQTLAPSRSPGPAGRFIRCRGEQKRLQALR